MSEQFTRLEGEVEALFDLTLRAYARFIFLRPMLDNKKLHDRISKEAKEIGFQQVRNWLYWALVQELAKICADKDPRSPSIMAMTQTLKDPNLRKQLEEK